jgi:hypothetical protein
MALLRPTVLFVVFATGLAQGPPPAGPRQWFVAPGGEGPGGRDAPFGRIQDAIDAAQPGDIVTIAPGTYVESVRTTRRGTPTHRITIRARDGRGSVIVTSVGRVLSVNHAYLVVEDLVLDGQYGAADLIRVRSSAHGFTLRRSEVRRTGRDAIDLGAPHDVLIEDSLVHHALNADRGRTDAHGIVAGGVRRLTIRNTEIHTFSGDAFQVDPGRSAGGWTDVLIEGCRFWLAPLADPENGFRAGTVPGENAIDTKASGTAPRARLTIRGSEAWGFQHGLIGNMAAFNLKENVEALVDRVTVFDSEIAFRLRGRRANGGALVRIQNAVVHSSAVAFRYEDNVERPRIYNATIGRDVGRIFVRASSRRTVAHVRNFLVLGEALPPDARHASNLAVDSGAFVDASRHDYRLSPASSAIDAGVAVAGVATDRLGIRRPQGRGRDVGAYEFPLDGAGRDGSSQAIPGRAFGVPRDQSLPFGGVRETPLGLSSRISTGFHGIDTLVLAGGGIAARLNACSARGVNKRPQRSAGVGGS